MQLNQMAHSWAPSITVGHSKITCRSVLASETTSDLDQPLHTGASVSGGCDGSLGKNRHPQKPESYVLSLGFQGHRAAKKRQKRAARRRRLCFGVIICCGLYFGRLCEGWATKRARAPRTTSKWGAPPDEKMPRAAHLSSRLGASPKGLPNESLLRAALAPFRPRASLKRRRSRASRKNTTMIGASR